MKFKKIYVEITNMCNKNCSFCSKDNRKKEEMSLDKFEFILKQIKPYTNYIYLHVKGEPLLHSSFSDIIRLCNEYNINVNITTNGSLMYKYKDLLKNDIIKQINISLHSFESDIMEDYLNNIFDVVDDIKYNKSIVYRFWAIDNGQLSNNNKYIINKLCERYHIDTIDLSKKNIKLSSNLYLNFAEKFEWPNINNPFYSDKGTCQGTRTHIAILVDGTVIPCCLDSNGIMNLGNIFASDLNFILKSERFNEINNSFKNNFIYEELCKHCTYRCRFNK